jgi:hypothetical protein
VAENSAEIEKTNNILENVLGLSLDVLDSVDFSQPPPEGDTSRISELIINDLSSIEGKSPKNIQLKRRAVRPNDYIKQGEHPGIWLVAQYSTGETLNINIYGGIRDIRGQAEYQDSTFRFAKDSIHEDRTIGLGDKSTQINIQFFDGKNTSSELWINDSPGNKAAVVINSLRRKTGDKGYINSNSPVIFRDQERKNIHYNKPHQQIRSIISSCLNILPD